MEQGFWAGLPRPIIGLSPMDGVTDAAFRFVVAKYGRPDVIFTEFTSVEGIRAGAERLMDDFLYDPIERPVVAQLFGADPAAFFIGSLVAAALGFDGIDINMGCPAKTVTEHGAGAALIRDPERAQEIVRQARAASRAWADGMTLEEAGVPAGIIALVERRRHELGLGDERQELPVSVKTRLGYSQPTVEEWIPRLLEVEPVTLSLHGRTLAQGYTGLADWDQIARAGRLVRESGLDIRFLGNGDVADLADAHRKVAAYGVDGVLIGRASTGNPWVFQGIEMRDLSVRAAVALEQARELDRRLEGRGFLRIRKHLLDYLKGSEEAKDLRMQAMRASTLPEVEAVLRDVAAPAIVDANELRPAPPSA